MMEAKKSRALEILFAAMNRRALRKHFYAHHLRGREHLKVLDPKRPIIFYANHSNWWDGLLAFHLCHDILGMDGILMMDVKQLARYRFFQWIGAFSVEQENKWEAMKSIQYAIDQIRRFRRILWMYPQGAMIPNDRRPIVFYSGLSHVVKHLGEAQLLPVAHRYEFLAEQRPESFTSIGPMERVIVDRAFNLKALTEALAQKLAVELDRLREDVLTQRLQNFTPTIRGRLSTHVKYDLFIGRRVP